MFSICSIAAAAEPVIEPVARPPPKELFYTEGPPELKVARLAIAKYSLKRASARIAAQKQEQACEAAEDGMVTVTEHEPSEALGKRFMPNVIYILCGNVF